MRYPSKLADFLFGRQSARRAVLEALYSDPSARIHLRELARRTGYSAPMVAKELRGLASHHLVVEKREANTRVFSANMRSPLFEDIRRLTVRPVSRRRRADGAADPGLAEASSRRPGTLREAALWGESLGRRDAMLREFVDEFHSAPSAARASLLSGEPPLLAGDERANAYYAAVAEHLALTHRLQVPAWTQSEERFLRKPFFPAGLESLKATLLVESPPAFRRRMIFVGADPLSRPGRAPRREEIMERVAATRAPAPGRAPSAARKKPRR